MSAAPKPRAKPGRPLKPLITKDAAIAAAIELVDRDGLAALSVQAVARAMNVTAPSLYHHFKDKDELLQRVARALLLEVGEQSQAKAIGKTARCNSPSPPAASSCGTATRPL
jgi:TetR/AcrR family tetracycline transcriptional repressor